MIRLSPTSPLEAAQRALDDCQQTLARLGKLCCEPDRSPRMAAIGDALSRARSLIERIPVDGASAEVALGILEEAGAEIGRLQVVCCAPARTPLYASILEGLTRSQIAVNESH